MPSRYNCPLFSFFIFFCILSIMVSHFRMSFHDPRLNRREGGRRHTHSLRHSDAEFPTACGSVQMIALSFSLCHCNEIQQILFLIVSCKHFKFSKSEFIKLNSFFNFIPDKKVWTVGSTTFMVLWSMIPCSFVGRYRRFGEPAASFLVR